MVGMIGDGAAAMVLTGDEAATLIRCHPRTIREMIRRGDLQGFVSGKTTRVNRESLERLIGGGDPGKAAAAPVTA